MARCFLLSAIILNLSGCFQNAWGQDTIVLKDSLGFYARAFPVKMGVKKISKVWNLSFGDYSVIDSDNRGTRIQHRENILGTKSETKVKGQFSFVLKGEGDTAFLYAQKLAVQKDQHYFPLSESIGLGEDAVLEKMVNFSASIGLSSDTARRWELNLSDQLVPDRNEVMAGTFTDGKTAFSLQPVSSELTSKKNKGLPARGYGFVLEGTTKAAVQYLGSGFAGLNRSIIWLHPELPPDIRLALAAAMAAIIVQFYEDVSNR